MGDYLIRAAQDSDFPRLSAFLNFQTHIHRHLDWRSPLEWLGQQPFLLAEEKGNLRGVLACPPDPPQIAWIRLFASSSLISPRSIWNSLFSETVSILRERNRFRLVSLALQNWYEDLLISSKFITQQNIVVLEWNGRPVMPIPMPQSISIRKMEEQDLPEVGIVDHTAFDPLWHNSAESLMLAFRQSSLSTVAVENASIIGYQISTSIPLNGHLARLAVAPEYQGKNIGYNLVDHLLREFKKQGVMRVTVNTQNDNRPSLAVYQKLGFRKTGEILPVYEFPLR